MTGSDHSLEVGMSKNGTKHISKSKRAKHDMFGSLFQMSKNGIPLWRETHRSSFGSWDAQ